MNENVKYPFTFHGLFKLAVSLAFAENTPTAHLQDSMLIRENHEQSCWFMTNDISTLQHFMYPSILACTVHFSRVLIVNNLTNLNCMG